MSDTEIETLIRRLLFFHKNNTNGENEKHIEDIETQLVNATKKFPVFEKNFHPNININYETIIFNLLQQLNFIYFQEKDIIWNTGDKVNEIYIIFLGEVNIYKQQHKRDKNEPKVELILEKGDAIGEDCLKKGQFHRTYLARAKTRCILGKLGAKEYYKIFSEVLNEENNLINSFFKGIQLFSHDYNKKIKNIVLRTYYNKNHIVFNQNEPFNTFYFILSGIVRITIKLNKYYKSKIDQDILIGKNTRFTTSNIFEIKGYYNESNIYNIIDLTDGDIIGGIEFLFQFDTYKYTAKCLTNVELLKMDLIQYNQILVYDEVQIFYEKIKKQAELIKQRIKMLKEGKGPIQHNDYILSKNKFTKAFLLNHPLHPKFDHKSELYINSGSNPIKVKTKYSKKKLKNTKLFLNSIEDYKTVKRDKLKKNNTCKYITTKDFLTNIDYKHKVPTADIFPKYFSSENSHRKEHKIKNKNSRINNICNSILNSNTKRSARLQTINTFLKLEKAKKFNLKSYSQKRMYQNKVRLINNNQININKKFFALNILNK